MAEREIERLQLALVKALTEKNELENERVKVVALLAEVRRELGKEMERTSELRKKVACEESTVRAMTNECMRQCMRRDRDIEALERKVEGLTCALAEAGRKLPRHESIVDRIHMYPARILIRFLDELDEYTKRKR